MAKDMMDIALKGVDGGEDLKVENGDFAVVESTSVHMWELIHMAKGDLKDNPTACVDRTNFLDSENPQLLANEIARELAKDGMDVRSVVLGKGGNLDVTAFYK